MSDKFIVRVHYRTLGMNYNLFSTYRQPGYVHYVYSTATEADARIQRVLKEGIHVAQRAKCGSLVRYIPATQILAADLIRCLGDWTKEDIPTLEETL